jgi:branched-subunit amino acid aminotransferase/4-amino-4-deoxychorismate lyase
MTSEKGITLPSGLFVPGGITPEYVMVNGILQPAEKEISLDTIALDHDSHYGAKAFEGTRVYLTQDKKNLAFLALDQHNARLIRSANYLNLGTQAPSTTEIEKIKQSAGAKWAEIKDAFEEPLDADKIKSAQYSRTVEELNASNIELVLAEIDSGNLNPENGIYIRTILGRGFREDTTSLGVFSGYHQPLELAVVWEWSKYLGEKGFKKGIAVRIDEEIKYSGDKDAQNKLALNYARNQRGKNRAKINGFNEAIYCDEHGFLLEGSGENLILMTENGSLITPRRSDQPILDGITIQIVERLAENLGYEVNNQQRIHSPWLFKEEIIGAIFTGTACEVTPIWVIYDPENDKYRAFNVPDRLKILQQEYMNFVTGGKVHPKNKQLQEEMLTYVPLER